MIKINKRIIETNLKTEDLEIEPKLRPQSMDTYIGQEKKKINKYSFNIVYYGEGKYIIDQLPKPNELVNIDSTIMLMLGDKK